MDRTQRTFAEVEFDTELEYLVSCFEMLQQESEEIEQKIRSIHCEEEVI